MDDFKIKLPKGIDIEQVIARVGRGGRITLERIKA